MWNIHIPLVSSLRAGSWQLSLGILVSLSGGLSNGSSSWSTSSVTLSPVQRLIEEVLSGLYNRSFAPVKGDGQRLPGKSHRCLTYAGEALLPDEGLLDSSVIEPRSVALDPREGG